MPTEPAAFWGVDGYEDHRGRRPVNEFLDTLPLNERARVVRAIELLKTNGTRLRMPYARSLESKLWELRVPAGRMDYRVIYTPWPGHRFVLLHAFAKKTQKTPLRELEIARRRLAELMSRGG
jgi:phage-related protein